LSGKYADDFSRKAIVISPSSLRCGMLCTLLDWKMRIEVSFYSKILGGPLISKRKCVA
jgi:hypothetical protein